MLMCGGDGRRFAVGGVALLIAGCGGHGRPLRAPASLTNPTCAVASALVPIVAAVGVRTSTEGDVEIATEPAGAEIFVDDPLRLGSGFVGTTPWRGEVDGDRTLMVRKPGYATTAVTITAATPRPHQVRLVLADDGDGGVPWLRISANVAPAELHLQAVVDGTVEPDPGPLGLLPHAFPVKPGRYRLTALASGFRTTSIDLDVPFAPGTITERCLTLAPLSPPHQ